MKKEDVIILSIIVSILLVSFVSASCANVTNSFSNCDAYCKGRGYSTSGFSLYGSCTCYNSSIPEALICDNKNISEGCTELDGGENYYSASDAIYKCPGCQDYHLAYELCLNNTLREVSCIPNLGLKITYHNCTDGCDSNACIPDETPTNISTCIDARASSSNCDSYCKNKGYLESYFQGYSGNLCVCFNSQKFPDVTGTLGEREQLKEYCDSENVPEGCGIIKDMPVPEGCDLAEEGSVPSCHLNGNSITYRASGSDSYYITHTIVIADSASTPLASVISCDPKKGLIREIYDCRTINGIINPRGELSCLLPNGSLSWPSESISTQFLVTNASAPLTPPTPINQTSPQNNSSVSTVTAPSNSNSGSGSGGSANNVIKEGTLTTAHNQSATSSNVPKIDAHTISVVSPASSDGSQSTFNINPQASTVSSSNGEIVATAASNIQISTAEGKAYATKGDGSKQEIKVDPTNAVNSVKTSVKSDTIKEIKVIEYNSRVVYEISTEKQVKILALIKSNMRIKANVDVNTGEIVLINKPWWSFLATGA